MLTDLPQSKTFEAIETLLPWNLHAHDLITERTDWTSWGWWIAYRGSLAALQQAADNLKADRSSDCYSQKEYIHACASILTVLAPGFKVHAHANPLEIRCPT